MSSVLALGLDPRFVDFRSMPNLTPELVRAFIDALCFNTKLADSAAAVQRWVQPA